MNHPTRQNRCSRRLTGLIPLSVCLLVVAALRPAPDLCAAPPAPKKTAAAAKVLVTVNGEKITDADLSRAYQIRQVPEEEREAVRRTILEQLIDARLIGAYLAARDTAPTKEQLEEQLERIRQLAARDGKEPRQVLSDLGFTDESLKGELSLPLAWKRHLDRVVTARRLHEYFETHRAEFDGTQLRASQILIALEADQAELQRKAAEEKLLAIRARVMAKSQSFADAAREHSDAPSREKGGDIGWFPYSGKMPVEFTRVAFALQPGEVSQPFVTRYGVHLCQVTDRKPGDLSLEDVREQVLTRYSAELWKTTVAELRAAAKIEWKSKQD